MKTCTVLALSAVCVSLAGAQLGAKSPITSQGEDASKKGQAHCPL